MNKRILYYIGIFNTHVCVPTFITRGKKAFIILNKQ